MRFNATDHKPATDGFEPLPKGKYRVRIMAAEERENNNRTGSYLKVELEVLGPTHVGRKLWANMTTQHQNEQAQSIGLGQISAMARSIGRLTWDHEREIVGEMGEVSVGLEKDDPTRNRILGWVIPEETRGAGTYTGQHAKAAWEKASPDPGRPLGRGQATTHTDLSPAQSAAMFDNDDIPF